MRIMTRIKIARMKMRMKMMMVTMRMNFRMVRKDGDGNGDFCGCHVIKQFAALESLDGKKTTTATI